MRQSLILAAAAGLVFTCLAGSPARAGQCYEIIGCASTQYFSHRALLQLGCQPLWEVRNRIYKDRGYCFHTQAGISVFGNDGCRISDQNAVPLNDYERANVGAIVAIERAKGCHYGY